MRFLRAFVMFIGRLCIAAIFLAAGVGKFIAFEETSQYMASKGFTAIPLFLFGAALVEILGGLSLVFGYKARIGALILLAFLIPTTGIFHDFWNLEGAERAAQQIQFLKNLAIFGGLLYVLSTGAGLWSIDAIQQAEKSDKPEPKPEPKP